MHYSAILIISEEVPHILSLSQVHYSANLFNNRL